MKTSERMASDLDLRNRSESTKKSYLKRAKALVRYYMRPAELLGEEEIRAYLHHRDQRVKPNTLGVDVAAIKFLYDVTLDLPEVVRRIQRPKVPRPPLPDILSGTEVLQVLAAVESIKHRTILTTVYGAGLRIKEACMLCPKDIDSKRMLIKVRNAKGGKDRYVMLATSLLDTLREYWKATRPRGLWLFPGRNPDAHINPNAVRAELRRAVEKLDLTKRVTPHVLRHCFATHLIETGVDIRTVQAILGHSSIRSTHLYTQVSKAHVARTKSPLDKLGTKEGEVLG